MIRLLLALFWLPLALPAWASCSGTDLRATLTAADRAAIAAELAATPHAEGNHWRARRGDEVLHLVGTVHIADPRLDAPLARLQPLIETAGGLLLEMAAPEQAALEQAMKTRPDMVLLPDRTLPELLSERDWARLSEAMRARGMPPFMGAKMQPWLISMMLALPPCLAGEMANPEGLDMRLERMARNAGVAVRSLEGHEAAVGIFQRTPMDTQLAMIRSSLIGPDLAEDLLETLLAAYFDEAHAETLITLQRLTPRLTDLSAEDTEAVTALMEDQLIAARNRAWMPVLLQAVEDLDSPLVAAFGAGHLGGETGILRLLEAEGFALDRQPF